MSYKSLSKRKGTEVFVRSLFIYVLMLATAPFFFIKMITVIKLILFIFIT